MSCAELLRTQAYLDGELDAQSALEAARHMEGCSECSALAADVKSLRDSVRGHATRYRAPAELRARIGAQLDQASPPKKTTLGQRSFWLGAGSGIGVSALAAGLALFIVLPPSGSALVESLGDAHAEALMRGEEIAVLSSNHHTVKPWFAGRVALSPPVADFAGEGFTLAGGRVSRIADKPAAVVVYRHGLHEIDLYVWSDAGTALPLEGVRHGYHVIVWKKGDLDFAAVSDMEKAELEKFVGLVKAEPE
jgi:anti-sigma factor (TIGR02949 family)